MSTHTPGPWQLHKSDDTLVIGSDCREVAEACGDYTEEAERPVLQRLVEYLDHHGRRMEANARLIAAAPDLLSALKDARESIEALANMVSDATQFRQDVSDDLARINAAIAKAEGQ